MNQRNDYLNAIFSGFLLVLIFPTLSLSLIAWIALVPLLMVLPGKDLRSAGKLGFVTGFVYFYGVLYWLNILAQFDIIMIPGTIVLVIWQALYVSVFAILLTWLLQKYPKGLWWLTPIIWTTLEYIRGLGPLGFPWGWIGYSQAPNLRLIQICSITGVLGISFLVMLMNGLLAQFAIEWKKDNKVYMKTISGFIVLLLILAIIYTYGTKRIAQLPSNPKKITAGIAQGNIPQMMKWDPDISDENFNKYIQLSKEILKQNPQIIVWPETAITDILSENESYRTQLIDFSSTHNVYLLCGTLDGNLDEKKYYNAVYMVEPDGNMSQKYYKTHLVPFGEYLPLEFVFPFLKKLHLVPSHFMPGKELTVFKMYMADSSELKLSSVICFESIMPDISRAMVKRGAQILVIVTNDSWYGKSSAPYQHNEIAIFRAIENGVPIIRAANTGYSCFINETGRMLQGLDIYQSGILVENLGFEPRQTFYTQYGDWFPVLVGILLLVLVFSHGKSAYQKK